MSTLPRSPLPGRLGASVRARLAGVRASPALSPVLLRFARADGRHPADASHAPHLDAALEWLCAAQDACGPDGGISRGYSLAWNPYFRAQGWQPAYPETTGYIIPTLLAAAASLGRPALAERAMRAAEWEAGITLPDGSVQGGVVGEPLSPAIFNTGQVMLGWLAALEAGGPARLEAALASAGSFLVSAESNGRWTRGNSRFARADATAYNARAAWALAEAGAALGRPGMTDAAARVLRRVAASQLPTGWFPGCCLSDPAQPLLHTLVYTIRGLAEGGRVLGDAALVAAALRAARPLAEWVGHDGQMPGRFASDWRGTVRWSCLTGQAQCAGAWLRLREIAGGDEWNEPAGRVLGFLKRMQDRGSRNPGVRGGIAGSHPVGGGYGRHEILSWATKFFADALMRDRPAAAVPALSRLA